MTKSVIVLIAVRKNSMNEQDFETVENMKQYGGSFVVILASLAQHADPINLQKIKDTWPEYWETYSKM